MPCSISWLRSTRRELAIEHASECFQQLTIGRCAIGRLRQHRCQPAPQEWITRRLGRKLHRQRNEPGSLTGARARPRHRSVLLEEREEEGTLGGEMAIDRALGESSRQRDFIERRDLEAPLREQLEPSRDEQCPGLSLAPLVNDSHGYLGYRLGPSAQAVYTVKLDTNEYRRYRVVP